MGYYLQPPWLRYTFMVGSDASMSLVLRGADLDSMGSCYSGLFDISILHRRLTKRLRLSLQ